MGEKTAIAIYGHWKAKAMQFVYDPKIRVASYCLLDCCLLPSFEETHKKLD